MKIRDSQQRFKEMPEVIPTPGDTAFVVIDMQYGNLHPDYGVVKRAKDAFISGAYDRGYEVVLLEDCCATVVAKYHEVTCEEMDDIFCKVRSADQVISAIERTQVRGTFRPEDPTPFFEGLLPEPRKTSPSWGCPNISKNQK